MVLNSGSRIARFIRIINNESKVRKIKQMQNRKPRVVVTRKLPEIVEVRLNELFDTSLNNTDEPFSRDQLVNAVRESDILVPTVGDKIDSSLLALAGKNFKLIANYGAGYDHIDVKTAMARGIMVTNTPGVSASDTADIAMALILALPRRMKEGADRITDDTWEGWKPTALLGNRISGKRLGILGMGRIGRKVAARASAFGMEIIYHSRRQIHPEIEKKLNAVFYENLDAMLPDLDILSIHTPHTPDTFHLIDSNRLNLLNSSAFIVNTARGEVIDQKALIRSLRAKKIAGAGLDVYEGGRDVSPELKTFKNVLLLPHMSSATVEGRIEMGEKVIVNIKTLADGHRPPDQVLPSML